MLPPDAARAQTAPPLHRGGAEESQRRRRETRRGSVVSRTIMSMEQVHRLTAVIEKDEDAYVALCPELDIASQGASIEEARSNLVEALTLFFETADQSEVEQRLRSEIFVTQVEVRVA